ncbi:MAG: S1C family serine protease [Myxococcota bacterium]
MPTGRSREASRLNRDARPAIYSHVGGRQPQYHLPHWVVAFLAAAAALAGPARAQDLSDARRVAIARKLQRSTVSIRGGRAGGSGFVVGPERWIVTNAHVARANWVAVRFSGDETRRGRMVARSRDRDLAVIEVRGDVPVPPLVLGDSDDVEVGQTVLAFGSPFGLEGTLTQGIVSARRDMGAIQGVIQTDAAVNPGNSGGPLVNAKGRVIGVNTAILSRSGASHGIGFAVPSNEVRRFLEQVRGHLARRETRTRAGKGAEGGRDAPCCGEPGMEPDTTIGRTWIGILGEDFRRRGLRGIRIRRVVPRSPAAQAGLRGAADPPPAYVRRLGIPWTGHVIVAVGGRRVRSMKELRALLARHDPGDRTRVVFTTATGSVRGEAVLTLEAPPSHLR